MQEKTAVYAKNNLELDIYNLKVNEALFHNANGYIGIRYDFEEGYPEGYSITPSQYINGFYDYAKLSQAEKLYGLVEEKQTTVNIADTQTIRMYFAGEEFSMFNGTILHSKLSLDMDKGITVRDVLWRSPQGKEFNISIKRMTSFYQSSLFTIEYEVEPLNFSGEVMIESNHNGNVLNYVDPDDPRCANECIQYLTPLSCEIKESASYITSRTSKSGLEVCSCVKNIIFQENQQEFIIDNNRVINRLSIMAKTGEKIRLVKYAVFCDSIRYENCTSQAAKEMEQALAVTLEKLYKKQHEYLNNYWNNCGVEIEGDDELNAAIRFSLYQLIQSVGKDPYSNVAPKGLSGDGYEGHYFWDAEMYIQPFFTITNPDISRMLIEYRHSTLDMARENARILGHESGVLYPWRTIMGRECSGYFPSGSAQYHINGDIAYAIIAYYLMTKDIAFIQEIGAEIIYETARLWMDVGNFHAGQFFINGVTGPDEYTCIVNNNYYTNALAQYHLNWAVKFYEILKGSDSFNKLKQKIELKESEIKDFKRAAENMYLPYDEKLKINPQDDSFLQKKNWNIDTIPLNKFPLLLHYHPLHLYRHQICKQADTVIVSDIFSAGEDQIHLINKEILAKKIKESGHPNVLVLESFSDLPALVVNQAHAGDFVIGLGAGDISKWIHELPAQLERINPLC